MNFFTSSGNSRPRETRDAAAKIPDHARLPVVDVRVMHVRQEILFRFLEERSRGDTRRDQPESQRAT